MKLICSFQNMPSLYGMIAYKHEHFTFNIKDRDFLIKNKKKQFKISAKTLSYRDIYEEEKNHLTLVVSEWWS